MQQPPNYPNYEGWQQPQPQQTNTQYPPQQPQWQPQYSPPPTTYYPPQQQFQQPPMMAPARPPRKKRNPWLILALIAGVLVLLASAIGYAVSTSSPTLTPEQFRASAQETTVENLDKDSNADKGKNVFFTCTITSFVKDDSGN